MERLGLTRIWSCGGWRETKAGTHQHCLEEHLAHEVVPHMVRRIQGVNRQVLEEPSHALRDKRMHVQRLKAGSTRGSVRAGEEKNGRRRSVYIGSEPNSTSKRHPLVLHSTPHCKTIFARSLP